ncbi:MAG: phosphatidylserine decarboxylase family protein [Lentisphaeria bacterium]|nr:phosphatidylserine decarboxylase family protein [Lentisphaerota bacterium]MBR7144193.1 phosphatidylserine decarboxylase family protein [Lentisphaeria bacterium]
MTLTRYGIREWGGGGVLALVLLVGCYFLAKYVNLYLGIIPGVLIVLVYGFTAFFFRNPRRKLPEDPELLISPADGTVRDITVVEDFDQAPFEGKALRIGIFLSVLSVHVNRVPAELQVISKHYREGKYLDARNPECARENEAMTIAGNASAAGKTFPMAIRQISGAIARRIVCPVEPGTVIKRGNIYGMIKFGSRTELYLPADDSFEVLVKVGDKVSGGSSVIARIKKVD